MKAYEELWDSRHMKQPIANIKTFPAEKLEKEVNRSWKLEQNLNSKCPVPVRYHRLPKARNPLLDHLVQMQEHPYIVKGRYLFITKDECLHCLVYFRSGHLKRMWSSDKLSFDDDSDLLVRGTSYTHWVQHKIFS